MDTPSPRSAHVLSELLSVGYRAYPRSLANGVIFALLAAWFLRNILPLGFLLQWLGFVVALNIARLALSRRYLRLPQANEMLRTWVWRAAAGYALSGLAWGVLGASLIHSSPSSIEAVMILFFTISLFAISLAASPASHPPIYFSFLFASMVPMLAMEALQPGEDYRFLFLSGALFLVAASFIGRNAHRYIVESIAMRHENVELLHDLIAQKDELDKANRAKTHFLAAASHDLRQPMQAVVLLVESLQERIREPGTRRLVESIRSSVVSMAALLNAILDVSRFDAGTVKPELTHFPVAQVLDRLRGAFGGQAAQKGIALRVCTSSALVHTDAILLYRILANIANNALRYTLHGKVLVGCRHRPEGLAIEVWDTGPGIPEENLEDIFREFYQLGNPQRDREQGLGLGLAIVERTARLLGHRLDVRSRLGRGSVFSLLVPYGNALEVRPARPAAPDWVPLLGCLVLVVEDEKEIRSAMKILLQGWGCTVLTAASGAEARALLEREENAPDIILADYRLGGDESGIQLLDSMVKRFPLANGILISGDIAPQVLKEAQASGYTLLHKPLRPARLRALLGNLWRERVPAVPNETAA
jgi:signal transduction histidine kinase/CheY-like chemotaxis protein